jgi:hypothetical protein
MNTNDMTIETANQIWNDCYNSNDLSLWNKYTSAQRLQAIDVRDAHANGGQWGIWNISDRD